MKFWMTFTVAILGVGLIIAAAPSQQEINYAEMAEDIQVMCRIVDKTMQEAFEKDYIRSGFFSRRGCQGFYLKNYGVVFLLDLQFPVAEKEMKVVKKKKEADLWERYQREVRRQPRPEELKWVVDKNEAYDSDRVDRLKARLAYLVGEYGARISQLGSDDMISIVVSGRTAQPFDFDVDFDFDVHVGKEMPHIVAIEGDDHGGKKIVVERDRVIVVEEIEVEETEDSKPKKRKKVVIAAPPRLPVLRFASHAKPATTLIVSFNRSQLEGKTGADWEALLKEADIVQY
ncbi:MAG: hypothetical protein O7E52_08695 [Candidatus Poribacteria bacterium]|nr:hypothetical protein [Candidatus Poribacteria bacterium]